MAKTTILLSEGMSWPGGLEQGRFIWLALPASPAEILEHLHLAIKIEQGEREAILAWGNDADNLEGSKPGIRTYITNSNYDIVACDQLETFARNVAQGSHRTTILEIDDESLEAGTVSILVESAYKFADSFYDKRRQINLRPVHEVTTDHNFGLL